MLFSSYKNRCDLKEHLHFGAELRYLALDTRIQKYCYLELDLIALCTFLLYKDLFSQQGMR